MKKIIENKRQRLSIETEELVINEEKQVFYILDIYDGVKEEVSLDKNILLLWHDYKKDFEEWFKIIPKDDSLLSKYLSKQTGILTLIENSKIFLVKRYYDNIIKDIKELNINTLEEDIKLPEDDIKINKNILAYIPNVKNILIKEKELKRKTTYNELNKIKRNSYIKQSILIAA